MTGDELAAVRGVESQLLALRVEVTAGFATIDAWMRRHEARHEALDDASRDRQVQAEHRLTAAESGITNAGKRLDEADKGICGIRKTVYQRTLWGAAVAGLAVIGGAIAQVLGSGKPGQ